MVKEISKNTRNELIGTLKQRYAKASKEEKTRILDEFIALSGYHRKHGVRLLGNREQTEEPNKPIATLRIYGEAAKEALIIVWEAADRICSKRLKAIMPDFIDAMERYKHLELSPEVRQRLLKVSAATIDRLLSGIRKTAHPHKKKRKPKKVNKQVPIRTFADWDEPVPGYLEIDFVAHGGGSNGAVVRRFVGYDRFSGVVAGQALARLYQNVRLYVNYFQPSFKLIEKERQGAKVRKVYDKPLAPYNRLLSRPNIEESTKKRLQVQIMQLDPVRLLHQIRDNQASLAALASPGDHTTGPGRTSLEEFLAQLPQLWRAGDARPTHRRNTPQIRSWRTRKDSFKEVWPDVLRWLQSEPDTTAKDLFKRLRDDHPGSFTDGQLRTMQRRVKEWRQIMAKELVHSCLDVNTEHNKIVPIGANN